MVGKSIFFMHFENGGGIAELVQLAAAALFLNLTQLLEGSIELAGEALAMDPDLSEGAVVLAECEGHRESCLGLRMVGQGPVFPFSDAEREEVGLDGGGAVHPPGRIDQQLDEL